MKRKTTKEILAESFIELTQAKAIHKISINEIVENCDLTKPTFYRYFKDKYDLIAWIYTTEAQKNVDKIGEDGYLWRDTLTDGLQFYEKNRKFMINALKHTSGRDSFIDQINKADIEYITAEIRKKRNCEQIPDDLAAIVRIYCYGTAQFLREWILSDNPSSCESVARAMEISIPDALKPYLCE